MTGVSAKSAAGIAAWASQQALPIAVESALGLDCNDLMWILSTF